LNRRMARYPPLSKSSPGMYSGLKNGNTASKKTPIH
jgi:hypothetical protein